MGQNPTITIGQSSDTGVLIEGHEVTALTGGGIVLGGVGGYMAGGKKHGLIGALVGLVAGFFVGRALDEYKAAPPKV